jgi:hypothetical protein
MLVQLDKIFDKRLIHEIEDGREINVYKLENVSTCGESNLYPNVLFYSHLHKNIINPVNEKTMSLGDIQINFNINRTQKIHNIDKNNYFYFIYNTDNYYHFVYDTLPYLISYLEIKKDLDDIKLLMNYPNSHSTEIYKFVTEFLEILGIKKDNIEIINDDLIYQNIYISDSYTHGGMSNNPPRKEIFEFYEKITNIAKSKYTKDLSNLPKKIYISRRTWVHSDFSNIGTNYTNRRKLVNEDDLVEYLSTRGYVETFTETLSTIEKIILFSNCESVIGAIGGGLSNMVFCKNNTFLLCIVSPGFFDINQRFKYCFSNIDVNYFDETSHLNNDLFKLYMRVKFRNTIGEISDIKDDELIVDYSDENLSGWNQQTTYKKITIKKVDCVPLDKGLNSPWTIDLEKIKDISSI